MELKKADKFNPLLIWFLTAFYRLYLFTLRKKVIYSPELQEYLKEKKPVLIAFWHRDVNTLLYVARLHPMLSMISDSKDGQLVAQVMEQLGAVTARGSSRTNPVKALKSFIRQMRTGKYWSSIAVDGPKGPSEKAKSGIAEVARIFSCPICSVNMAYSSKWVLKKSWDQTVIAKPFSRVVFYFSLALPPITKDMNAKDPELLARLDASMSRNQNITLGYLAN